MPLICVSQGNVLEDRFPGILPVQSCANILHSPSAPWNAYTHYIYVDTFDGSHSTAYHHQGPPSLLGAARNMMAVRNILEDIHPQGEDRLVLVNSHLFNPMYTLVAQLDLTCDTSISLVQRDFHMINLRTCIFIQIKAVLGTCVKIGCNFLTSNAISTHYCFRSAALKVPDSQLRYWHQPQVTQ